MIIALADRVLLHVDLKPLAVLLQMREPRLAHVPQGHEPPRDAHTRLGHELLRGFGAVLRENFRDAVAELEPPAVGPVSERVDLADARQPLLQQLVFKGQIGLLF